MAEDIRQALKDALEPMSNSVRELSGRFGDFQVSTAESVAEIRTDMKHVRRECGELKIDVKGLREQWPRVEAHLRQAEDTESFKLQRPTDKKSDSNGLKVILPKSAARWIPWLIVTTLLGAALAGGLIFGRSTGMQEGVEEATKYFTQHPEDTAAGADEAKKDEVKE